ncbi:SusC/RagA family TonB-linked outer membrane protein [Sunxiuqinia elliptica]
MIDIFNIKPAIVLRSLLLLGALVMANAVLAQEKNINSKDTVELVKVIKEDPGAFFSVDKLTSTAAVSSVSGNKLYKTANANLTNTLYGVLPGLTVSQGSGQPGYDAATLHIRGMGTYNNQEYTIYVDGFQTTSTYFQYLSPSEIESVAILKDAAALATFGMKGANGVLWVTTKRGSVGKTKIQVQARTGFQQPLNINKPLGSYDYARLYNEAISNDNGRVWSPAYTDSDLQAYQNGTGVNTDWYDEVLKDYAPYSSLDASFSGGSEAARYYLMVGYMQNGGLYDTSNDDTHSNAQMDQYTIRTNLDFKVFDIFEGKVDIGGRIEDRKYPNFDGNSLWANLAKYPSNIYAPQNPNGSWTGTTTYPDNPLASIRALGYHSTHDRTLQANFKLKERLDFIADGLYMSQGVSFSSWTRGTYNVTQDYARYIGDKQQTTNKNTNPSVYDDNGTNQWNWVQFTTSLGYQHDWGKNHFISEVNYLHYTYNIDQNQNGRAGVNTNYAHQNIAGRLHYDYDTRYVAELGFAYSASDNYAEGNRWGFYPTISGAWILSNEAFLKDNKLVDYLKLRASLGQSGFDSFWGGRYFYQLYYSNLGAYPTGNDDPKWNQGMGQAYVPNSEIFAEKSTKYNVGIDGKLFGKLDVTLDGYLDKRTGIVTRDNSLMAVLGTTPPYINIGEVTNKGVELSLNFTDQLGDFSYYLGGIVAYSSNKIDYMAEIPQLSPEAMQTGNPMGSSFGYQADGFYDITDFDSNGQLRNDLPVPGFGAVQPGDIKYVDRNGDAEINEADLVKVGKNYFPKVNYSISLGAAYKGFDFSMIIQGVAGRTVNLLHVRDQSLAFVDNGNAYALAEGRWAYYPEQGIDTRAEATYPRLSTMGNSNNYINSTFWMKNGDFIKLRNVELGYTIPKALGSKLGLAEARFFVSGANLLTLSSLLDDYNIDPETMSGYAAMKSMNIGVTVNF